MKKSVNLSNYFPLTVMLMALFFVSCGGKADSVVSTVEPLPTNTAVPDHALYLPKLDELEGGWHTLYPRGETGCATDTEYSFYVRPADPHKLLIYFQAGGSCWTSRTCDLDGGAFTYDAFVDTDKDRPDNSPFGIFNFANEANPFADYSMVFIPYCTGDIHLGNNLATYDTDDGEINIHHNGFNNATAALTWTFDNFTAPETVFVTGSSAGAIPSPFYTMFVAEQYPDAAIVQLGDSAGGYRTDTGDLLNESWNWVDALHTMPGLEDVAVNTITFETFYIVAATQYPHVNFSQYNTANDRAQLFFLGLMGVEETPLLELLQANYADIETAVPNNHVTYTAGGALHTILGIPEFYTYQINGLPFHKWITALAIAQPVEDMMCTNCTQPETTTDHE